MQARQMVLLTLRRVHSGAFSNKALAGELGLSAQDRAFVTDVVYGTLRYQRFVDASLAPLLQQPQKLPLDVRNALRSGSYEILQRHTPRHAAVHAWVDVIKSGPQKPFAGLVNAVLRQVVPPPKVSPHVRASVPKWLYKQWLRQFGAEIAQLIGQAMLKPEPLWVRAADEKKARALLIKDNCRITPGPLRQTLALQPRKPLAAHAAFKQGFIQPQNPASTLPVRALGEIRDKRVLDLCSGYGIKAAQLASEGAAVASIEISANKLKQAGDNMRRLKVEAAETHVADLRHVPNINPALYVLLDAPCSGTGTLRGNPELRLTMTPEEVQVLAELQADLLRTAAHLTCKGGLLVYAVCALTAAEGPEQITNFLQAEPAFTPVRRNYPVPSYHVDTGCYILPVGGLDGFFISVLRREH